MGEAKNSFICLIKNFLSAVDSRRITQGKESLSTKQLIVQLVYCNRLKKNDPDP